MLSVDVRMIKIDGLKVRGRAISKRYLVSKWRQISEAPFPRVSAFQIRDSDFDSVMKTQKCLDNNIRELKEWGRTLTAKGTDACVFNAELTGDVNYIIVIRETPYHDVGEVIEHELAHIARGDL